MPTMNEMFKAACVQNQAGADAAETEARAEELIREAAGRGADLIVTPEFFSCFHVDDDGIHTGPHAEDDHPTLSCFQALAAELETRLVLGSLAVTTATGKLANRQFVIDPTGAIVARYDKIHLFDVDIDDDDRFRESATFAPGETAVVTDTPWGGLGLSICYDLRFAYLYRDMAQAGALFLTCPAAFMQKTGEAHWHVLQRARAIETGCYVFAACQSGSHGKARTYGHSVIVGPWGEVLADAGEEEGIIVADIDPAQVAKARKRIPALVHDRAYAAPTLAGAAAAEAAE